MADYRARRLLRGSGSAEVGEDDLGGGRTFPWFQGKGFDLLITDLRSLPTNSFTLIEGFRLLPHLVHPHLSGPRHAVWLIPTPSFRRAAFAARDRGEASG